jgi:hypothetical protein
MNSSDLVRKNRFSVLFTQPRAPFITFSHSLYSARLLQVPRGAWLLPPGPAAADRTKILRGAGGRLCSLQAGRDVEDDFADLIEPSPSEEIARILAQPAKSRVPGYAPVAHRQQENWDEPDGPLYGPVKASSDYRAAYVAMYDPCAVA